MLNITKTELRDFIISIIVITFVFGFNDKQPSFDFSYWLVNFIKILFIVLISFALHVLMQKIVASKYGCNAAFTISRLKRYGFSRASKFPINFFGYTLKSLPLGIILPIIIALASNGQIFYAATGACLITLSKFYKLGREYQHLTEWEIAKITFSGILINVLLALIFKPFFPLFTNINIMLAISFLIPIPETDGSQLFFASRFLYLFTLIFVLCIAILLSYLSIITTLIIALVFAVLAVAISFNLRIKS